ncbi:hypothetical protein [Amycolatopsis sp. H20-H5]|uniref:hypothetical protein n=1 Tax=Amycolatopsis sp. H20-H5 TaxID=3046309 RepID=UPI002DBD505F|nr:hypothetical protein [Amycolatopsis sp. H20-H5]MEC3975938.1 hypothetical protein [Amycolatopsis sp. H20-H5]
MIQVNYPTSTNDPHFEVMEEADGVVSPITGELFRNRADAENEYADMVLDTVTMKVRLVEHDIVYFAHCVVCGRFPGDTDQAYPEWCWVLEDLPNYPDWQATEEQHVFCPDHRPSKED